MLDDLRNHRCQLVSSGLGVGGCIDGMPWSAAAVAVLIGYAVKRLKGASALRNSDIARAELVASE